MKKKVYLVDYENVAEDGMNGFSNLDTADEVYIFYTEKNKRIGLDVVEKWLAVPNRANVYFMKVTSGKQALDIQLATFLGSLVADGNEEEKRFYIVSKDKGYDHIIRFWQGRKPGILVSRVNCLQDSGKAAEPAQTAATLPTVPTVQASAPVKTSAPIQVSAPETSAEPSAETAAAAETAVKPAKKTRTRRTKTAKQAEAEKQDTAVKKNENGAQEAPAETEPQNGSVSAAEPAGNAAEENQEQTPSQKKNELNNRVLQALSKAKFDNKTAGQAASLTAAFSGRQNAKRDIYTAIVKHFGQKKGLEIYRCIKGIL